MWRWLREAFAVYPSSHVHRDVELVEMPPVARWYIPEWSPYLRVCRVCGAVVG